VAGKLSIGAAWTEAAAFLRRERRVLAPVVLGLIMVPAVIASMVQPPAAAGRSPEPGAWMIVAVAMVLVMLVGQMVIVLLANDWRDSVGQAIRRALGRLPIGILAGLAVMIPVLILLSVIAGGTAALGGGEAALRSSKLGSGGLIVMLLVIALVIFATVRLLPLFAVVASGSGGPIRALRHSFALTRGHFWKLLVFVLLMSLAFGVLAMAVGAVIGSIVTIALGAMKPWSVSLLLVALAGGLMQAAFATVFTAMIARITSQLEGGATSGT